MNQRGFTLIELVIVVAIVGILASAAMPLARWSVKRNKEHQLQQNLLHRIEPTDRLGVDPLRSVRRDVIYRSLRPLCSPL